MVLPSYELDRVMLPHCGVTISEHYKSDSDYADDIVGLKVTLQHR